MPQTQTAAAAPRKATALPPMPEYRRDIPHIYVFCALQADAAHAHLDRIETTALRRSKFRETNATLALSKANWALVEQRSAAFKEVREAGELLLCWHGTRANEVPA